LAELSPFARPQLAQMAPISSIMTSCDTHPKISTTLKCNIVARGLSEKNLNRLENGHVVAMENIVL
jgi:hypothetical protein